MRLGSDLIMVWHETTSDCCGLRSIGQHVCRLHPTSAVPCFFACRGSPGLSSSLAQRHARHMCGHVATPAASSTSSTIRNASATHNPIFMDINSVSGFVLLGEDSNRSLQMRLHVHACIYRFSTTLLGRCLSYHDTIVWVRVHEACDHLPATLPSFGVLCVVWDEMQLLVQHEQGNQQPLPVQQCW